MLIPAPKKVQNQVSLFYCPNTKWKSSIDDMLAQVIHIYFNPSPLKVQCAEFKYIYPQICNIILIVALTLMCNHLKPETLVYM